MLEAMREMGVLVGKGGLVRQYAPHQAADVHHRGGCGLHARGAGRGAGEGGRRRPIGRAGRERRCEALDWGARAEAAERAGRGHRPARAHGVVSCLGAIRERDPSLRSAILPRGIAPDRHLRSAPASRLPDHHQLETRSPADPASAAWTRPLAPVDPAECAGHGGHRPGPDRLRRIRKRLLLTNDSSSSSLGRSSARWARICPASRVVPRPWPYSPARSRAGRPALRPKKGVIRVVEQIGPPQA